jgi:hypothetical protein
MGQITPSQKVTHIGPLQIGIIVLAVITAILHLFLAVNIGTPSLSPFPLIFYLNGLGYLVLVAALYLPQFFSVQSLVRWILIIYTALTIMLYFVMRAGHTDLFGYSDKLVEVVLFVLLIIEDRQARQRQA